MDDKEYKTTSVIGHWETSIYSCCEQAQSCRFVSHCQIFGSRRWTDIRWGALPQRKPKLSVTVWATIWGFTTSSSLAETIKRLQAAASCHSHLKFTAKINFEQSAPRVLKATSYEQTMQKAIDRAKKKKKNSTCVQTLPAMDILAQAREQAPVERRWGDILCPAAY